MTLFHLAYREHGEEVAGKAFDFSARSAQGRWHAGQADMARMLEALGRGEIEIGRPGLSISQATTIGRAPSSGSGR